MKTLSLQSLIISVAALILTATSPAFSQIYGGACPGGVCRTDFGGATPPAARTTTTAPAACAPCARSCGFAPFGGFFRALFGRSCSCQAAGGTTCLADPVRREFAPEAPAEQEPSCQTAEDPDPEPCAEVTATELEQRLINCAISERRRLRGESARFLRLDRALLSWARYNSNAQASSCRLGHFSGYSFEIAGQGYTSPEAAVRGWLGSAPHRALLLDGRFSRVGAAVYRGRDGLLYWTMTFGY